MLARRVLARGVLVGPVLLGPVLVGRVLPRGAICPRVVVGATVEVAAATVDVLPGRARIANLVAWWPGGRRP